MESLGAELEAEGHSQEGPACQGYGGSTHSRQGTASSTRLQELEHRGQLPPKGYLFSAVSQQIGEDTTPGGKPVVNEVTARCQQWVPRPRPGGVRGCAPGRGCRGAGRMGGARADRQGTATQAGVGT